ncbi:MAG: hypothetical protein AAF740_00820, partial [Bacteroidota bacterium]
INELFEFTSEFNRGSIFDPSLLNSNSKHFCPFWECKGRTFSNTFPNYLRSFFLFFLPEMKKEKKQKKRDILSSRNPLFV